MWLWLCCVQLHTKILCSLDRDSVALSVKTFLLKKKEKEKVSRLMWLAGVQLQMSARQAEVQASICVSIREKKSLVPSAFTKVGELDSRAERSGTCSPEDVRDLGDPGGGRNVHQFGDESLEILW